MRTIFENGAVIGSPGENGGQTSQCMIIKDDIVEFVGDSDDNAVQTAREQGATTTDLDGCTILPGFIDGHMHLLMFGSLLETTSLIKCKNLEEIRATISAAAKARPDLRRIYCSEWMYSSIDGLALASMLEGLDELNRPIFISAKDLHATWCNAAALKELNVQDTPDPTGGTIHRDEKGNPSGLLSEAANIGIVWPHIANNTSQEENINYIRKAVQTYNSAGYTGMIEMATDENILKAALAFKAQQNPSIRLSMYWIIKPSTNDEDCLTQVDRAIELSKQYSESTSPDFRIVGIKTICDGIIDACTASLLEPYSSNGSNCDPLWPAEQLKKVVHKADAAGLQCALHAIGDQTVNLAINTLASLPPTTRPRRHRIEHLELTSPEDSRRLGELGITASVQAVHADPAILRAWPKLIGSTRLARAFAYKEFHDHGANISLGTDAPTAPHLPFPNLYNATTRRSAREPESTATTNPHFALSVMEALAAASYGSAYSVFSDHRVGSLAVGKKADFVVVRARLEAERLLEARVLETWFDGRRVFRKED